MIRYSEDHRTAYYRGISFRKDAKTGYYLAAKPTRGKIRERLHVFLWRMEKGDIPEGHHIHHIDGDKENNAIENLTCILQRDHLSHHMKEQIEKDPQKYRDRMEVIRPLASAWHRSEEGRAWHSKHAKEQKHEEKEFVCQSCGKTFKALPYGTVKYCSNACKSNARRYSGVDNEERRCTICGKTFEINKYSKQQCCSRGCASVLRWDRIRQKRRESAGL